MIAQWPQHERIVITGVGLTAPNGNSLKEFRESLLSGRSGVVSYETRYFGPTVAGSAISMNSVIKSEKKSAAAHGREASAYIAPTRPLPTPAWIGQMWTNRPWAFTWA